MSEFSLLGFINSYQVVSLPAVLALLLWNFGPRLKRQVQIFLKHRALYRKYLRPSIFDFDVIVIGAGSAGIAAAETAVTLKGKVALIEKGRSGGTNLYSGSIPSKTLMRSSRVAQLFRRGHEFGLQIVEPHVDYRNISRRIRESVSRVEPKSNLVLLSQLGVECIEGAVKIIDPFRIEIDGKNFSTRNIVIATGAEPVLPEQKGFKDVPYYTTETFWQLEALPKRVLVLGGGPVGCEMAQALNRLGCETVLSERREAILQKVDPDVSELVKSKLESEGLTVVVKSEITHFEKGPSGSKAFLANGGQIVFDAVVVALGRRPVIQGFGLEGMGIELRRDGTIECDDYMRTKIPNIFACGDVAGPFQMVHAATHQARVAVKNALYAPLASVKADYTALPQITYTEPEVARVGWNETEANAQDLIFEAYKFHFKDLDRAVTEGETDGFVKVLCDKKDGRILGATIVGAQAGEIIGEFVLAIRKKMTLDDILETIHAYPSFMGANRAVADAWRRNRAPNWKTRALIKFHRWQRGEN